MWENILVTVFAFLISGIPLYLAVKLLGGKTGILKTAIVVFVSGFIVAAIREYVDSFGGLISFIVLIWIYREMFRLKWLKAFLAWLLQFVILAILLVLLFIFGIGWLATL